MNKYNDCGQTPYLLACTKGHLKIVEWLINDDKNCLNDKDKYNRTGFYLACIYDHIVILKLLIFYGFNDLNNKVNKCSPLSLACRNGYIEIVNLILIQPNIIIHEDIEYFHKNNANIYLYIK